MPKKPARPISPLYARYFTPEEKRALRAVPLNDPASEINLLRVLFAHFMESQQSAPKDTDSRVLALRTCFILSEQFAKLIRVQIKEHDPIDEIDDAIFQALDMIRKEMGID